MKTFTEFLNERAMFASLIGTVVLALEDAGIKHKYRKSRTDKDTFIVDLPNKLSIRVSKEYLEVLKGDVVVDSAEYDGVEEVVNTIARKGY